MRLRCESVWNLVHAFSNSLWRDSVRTHCYSFTCLYICSFFIYQCIAHNQRRCSIVGKALIMRYRFHCSAAYIYLSISSFVKRLQFHATSIVTHQLILALNVRGISSVSIVTIAHHERVQLPNCPRTWATYASELEKESLDPDQWQWRAIQRELNEALTFPIWRTNKGQMGCS